MVGCHYIFSDMVAAFDNLGLSPLSSKALWCALLHEKDGEYLNEIGNSILYGLIVNGVLRSKVTYSALR